MVLHFGKHNREKIFGQMSGFGNTGGNPHMYFFIIMKNLYNFTVKIMEHRLDILSKSGFQNFLRGCNISTIQVNWQKDDN